MPISSQDGDLGKGSRIIRSHTALENKEIAIATRTVEPSDLRERSMVAKEK
jgi:hypothetical protein